MVKVPYLGGGLIWGKKFYFFGCGWVIPKSCHFFGISCNIAIELINGGYVDLIHVQTSNSI